LNFLAVIYTMIYVLVMSDNRIITTIRLPPDLLKWARSYKKEHGVSVTHVIEELLEALREGRLMVRPRAGPSPFPREDIEAGSSPEYPILIAAGTRPVPSSEAPDPAEGQPFLGEKAR
jgi:hypothetical protein